MTNSVIIARERMVSRGTVWLLFLFLGWSYGSLGKVGLQILYYITGGFFFIGIVIRLFTLNSAITNYNRLQCIQAGCTPQEMAQLGVV